MARVSQAHLDARREQILDAARLCFSRNGFHRTSMQDIINEAGLSAGAVYRYFPGKADIIRAIATGVLGSVRSLWEEARNQDRLPMPYELLATVWSAKPLADPSVEMAQLIVQVISEALRMEDIGAEYREMITEVLAIITGYIAVYQENGVIDPDVPPEHVARTLLAIGHGFVLQRAILGDVTVDMFRSGIRGLIEGDWKKAAAS